jgi:HSP20 family protein
MRRMPCDPLRDLRAWQQRLERLAADQHGSAWAPPIDVYETADRYVVAAELPGLTRDQIDVSLQDNRLTIRGSRPTKVSDASQDSRVRYHQVERGHGTFQRTFEFADAIEQNGISADLRDGLLTITLPKRPVPKPRRIDVG